MNAYCGTCAFWISNGQTENRSAEIGECHRYAPGPQAGGNHNRMMEFGGSSEHTPSWPMTAKEEFCGEWRSPEKWEFSRA
jgi:hypothetical protein